MSTVSAEVIWYLVLQLLVVPLLLMVGVKVVSPKSRNGFARALGVCLAFLLVQGMSLALLGGHPYALLAVLLLSPFVLFKLAYGMGIFRTLLLQLVILAFVVALTFWLKPHEKLAPVRGTGEMIQTQGPTREKSTGDG